MPTSPTRTALDVFTEPYELHGLREEITERLAVALNTQHGDRIAVGRRIRLIDMSPVCLTNLTGTAQPPTATPKAARFDVLLDPSSTEALRRDHRVDHTSRVDRPAADTTRHRLRSIPAEHMILADND